MLDSELISENVTDFRVKSLYQFQIHCDCAPKSTPTPQAQKAPADSAPNVQTPSPPSCCCCVCDSVPPTLRTTSSLGVSSPRACQSKAALIPPPASNGASAATLRSASHNEPTILAPEPCVHVLVARILPTPFPPAASPPVAAADPRDHQAPELLFAVPGLRPPPSNSASSDAMSPPPCAQVDPLPCSQRKTLVSPLSAAQTFR